MQEGNRRRRREAGLARQMEHDARILAHRIEHHRLAEFRRELPHDEDRLVFQALQVRGESGYGLEAQNWREHGSVQKKAALDGIASAPGGHTRTSAECHYS
jgi:hypothetical protein